MKRTGQMLLWICFALLILLGAQTLVEGPEKELPPPPPLPVPVNAAFAAVSADASGGAVLEEGERSTRGYEARVFSREKAPVRSPVCESNGWPMTGRSWIRTVYTVCPPEETAG